MNGERERVDTNHQSQITPQQSPKCTLQHVEFVILYCHKYERRERRELIRITNHITTKSKMSLQHVKFVILYCHKYERRERREVIRITNQTKSKMPLQPVELVISFCHKYERRERERERVDTNHKSHHTKSQCHYNRCTRYVALS